MVELKLCVGQLDGTRDYHRIAIPVLTHSVDVLAVLRAKLALFYPQLTSNSDAIDVELQYEGESRSAHATSPTRDELVLDPARGLVLVRSSDGINEAARGHAARQELLRVFAQFHRQDENAVKYRPSKHVGVICDGKTRRRPIERDVASSRL
jgi:hypothetical protein